MVARSRIMALDFPMGWEDAFPAWTPMFHMGATDQMLATVMSGGKVIAIDGADIPGIVQLLAREKLGWLHLIPGMIDRFIAELERTATVPKGLRLVGLMADLVPRAVIARVTTLVQAPYVNTFGSTEAGSIASRGRIPIGEVPERLSKTQGSMCDVRLVAADDREVPDGEAGELLVQGASLFSGYWQAPEANAEVFRNGWFRTGDIFRRNTDGTLDFVDRVKYVIKSGGENIYPAEIENLLRKSPRIADAAVVRRRDAKWGEVPVAFVVPRDASLSTAAVIALCEGRLARYKLPRDVRFVSDQELPRSASGKIQRDALERILEREPAAAGDA